MRAKWTNFCVLRANFFATKMGGLVNIGKMAKHSVHLLYHKSWVSFFSVRTYMAYRKVINVLVNLWVVRLGKHKHWSPSLQTKRERRRRHAALLVPKHCKETLYVPQTPSLDIVNSSHFCDSRAASQNGPWLASREPTRESGGLFSQIKSFSGFLEHRRAFHVLYIIQHMCAVLWQTFFLTVSSDWE